MRLAGVAALLAASALAAGCGGSKTSPAIQTSAGGSCVNHRALTKLHGDIAAIRSAADRPTTNRLLGNPAVNHATDRFLLDVATAKIDNKRRNRLIDLAAGSLANQCEQCFQALEAARPIPSLRYGETGCGA